VSRWLLAWLLVSLVAAPHALAQEPDSDASAEMSDEGAEAGVESDDIDALLEGDDSIFGSADTYSYEPAGRRDPFRSLLRNNEQGGLPTGPRPEGIPGLLIDEVTLIGVLRTPRGYMAQVQAADQQKSYLLKEGDKLFDGELVSIDREEVVFRQQVQDPAALKPYRDRVKTLNP
jgi:Tfp pilus assembly protein PilP